MNLWERERSSYVVKQALVCPSCKTFQFLFTSKTGKGKNNDFPKEPILRMWNFKSFPFRETSIFCINLKHVNHLKEIARQI